MSELVFERGLFATLAAALIVPELTTFLIFVYVIVSIATLATRQAWELLRVGPSSTAIPAAKGPAEPVALRLVRAPSVTPVE